MSRLLILLCMVGWALYTLHTNSNKSGDMVAHESKAFAAQPPAAPSSNIDRVPTSIHCFRCSAIPPRHNTGRNASAGTR